MRLRPHELDHHLGKGVLPAYLVTGDEPLQRGEAADAIRHHARLQGYTTRDLLEIDARFDWRQLAAEASSLSLFAERRILELRIPSGKPGREGSQALVEYVQRPAEGTLLLIIMPRLERSQTGSKWVKALESLGALVQIWPVEGDRLAPWIEQRMRSRGLTPAAEAVAMLADRIEGNLLAAAQEIDKLLLLHGPGIITPQQLADSVADSARFDVYGLVDSALQGKAGRCIRILGGLRAEGTAAPVVLWALTREIRLLCSLSWEVARGRSVSQAIASRRDIWEKRRPLVHKGLQRHGLKEWHALLRLCSQTDRAIKGRSPREPWLLMQDIAIRMAGRQAPDAG